VKPVLLLPLAAACLAAAPAQAAKPRGPTRALPRMPGSISNMDYPAAALRAGEEGIVEYEVRIGADGRAERCTILVSSGSAILDMTTCRLIQTRVRFTPARDADGRPTTDRQSGKMVWRLPR
jgi:protein TonB